MVAPDECKATDDLGGIQAIIKEDPGVQRAVALTEVDPMIQTQNALHSDAVWHWSLLVSCYRLDLTDLQIKEIPPSPDPENVWTQKASCFRTQRPHPFYYVMTLASCAHLWTSLLGLKGVIMLRELKARRNEIEALGLNKPCKR